MEGRRDRRVEGRRNGETEGWREEGPERWGDGGQPGAWTTAAALAALEQGHLYREDCPEQTHCRLGTAGQLVPLTGAFLEGDGVFVYGKTAVKCLG